MSPWVDIGLFLTACYLTVFYGWFIGASVGYQVGRVLAKSYLSLTGIWMTSQYADAVKIKGKAAWQVLTALEKAELQPTHYHNRNKTGVE